MKEKNLRNNPLYVEKVIELYKRGLVPSKKWDFKKDKPLFIDIITKERNLNPKDLKHLDVETLYNIFMGNFNDDEIDILIKNSKKHFMPQFIIAGTLIVLSTIGAVVTSSILTGVAALASLLGFTFIPGSIGSTLLCKSLLDYTSKNKNVWLAASKRIKKQNLDEEIFPELAKNYDQNILANNNKNEMQNNKINNNNSQMPQELKRKNNLTLNMASDIDCAMQEQQEHEKINNTNTPKRKR